MTRSAEPVTLKSPINYLFVIIQSWASKRLPNRKCESLSLTQLKVIIMANFTKNDLGATVVYSLMVDDFIHNNFATIESAEAYANEYLQYSDYIIQEHHLAPFNTMYKTIVNKLFNADRKYCRLVDIHQAELDLIDCDSPKFYKTESRQSRSEHKAYENILKLWEKLPKAEKYAFNKQYKKLFGYEAMAS